MMDEGSVTLRASYARVQITVENRDYHHLSRFEIGGGKRISRLLSGLERPGPSARGLGLFRSWLLRSKFWRQSSNADAQVLEW